MTDPTADDKIEAARLLWRAELAARREMLPLVRADGETALRRLLPIAQSDTGQSRRVAAFLLGLYNGTRFPFDLTNLRGLDYAVHDDCMTLLRADHVPSKEVHRYIEGGSEIFERLATDWGLGLR